MVQRKCLNEETLTGYLEGLLDAPVRAAVEQHVVGCDSCRSQLAFYMRILDEDVREEEESVVQAAMERWSRQPVPASGEVFSPMKGLAIAASLLLMATVTVFVSVNWNSGPSAGEVMERLLTEERPFEARLALQQYIPRTRAPNMDAGASRRLDLNLLGGAGAGNYSLGMFYLLEKNFEMAIDHLEVAVDEADAARKPAVHNDLGVAHLERDFDSPAQQVMDMNIARESFEASLALDSRFAPALFNLAILFSRQDLAAEAEARAKAYVDLDGDSQWADELRRLLNVD